MPRDHGTLDDAEQRAHDLRRELDAINLPGLSHPYAAELVARAKAATDRALACVEQAIALDDRLNPEE